MTVAAQCCSMDKLLESLEEDENERPQDSIWLIASLRMKSGILCFPLTPRGLWCADSVCLWGVGHCFFNHTIIISVFPSSLFFTCIVVVQSLSRVQHFVIPWTATQQPSLSFTISQTLLKLISIESGCYLTISSMHMFMQLYSTLHTDTFK